MIIDDWNDLIKGYDFENNESFELHESNQHFLKRKSDRVERKNTKSQSYDRNKNERAGIANSLQILKNRLNDNNIQVYESNNVVNIEKYSYQKHLLKCHENKDKVKKLFDNHSSWLKNMRNEVFHIISFLFHCILFA